MILRFDDPTATQLANSGGKGASLAKLFQGGFEVPPGVIVPAAAYASFAGSVAIDDLPYDDAEALRVACARLREQLVALPLPADVEAELREAVAPLLAKGA